jgi:hypothetical protein
MGKHDIVEITCRIVRDVPESPAIAIADGTTEKRPDGTERDKWYWIPRSQIQSHVHDARKHMDIIAIPEWLAEDRGLI